MSTPTSQSRLFTPLNIGSIELKHRIAMAPLTRMRATDDRVPTLMMKEYYSQRASVPGTLIFTEGTFVSAASCGGFPNAPGLWREDQVTAWKTITEEVHRKGCFMICQLFAMGRAGYAEVAKQDGYDIVGPSAIPIDAAAAKPREMTLEEINQTIVDFVEASKNAIRAGFDGVEIHVANGYLLDQFLQDTSNQRQDKYGGTVENRARLTDEVLAQVVLAIGSEKVGMRLSPWSRFQGMRMADPIPQFTHVVNTALKQDLAFLHVVEPRISGSEDATEQTGTLDFVYDLWKKPLFIAGGYTPSAANILVNERFPERDIIVVFGRSFLANPDLVFRLREGLVLNKHDRSTFYIPKSPVGYVDYPFSKEYQEVA